MPELKIVPVQTRRQRQMFLRVPELLHGKEDSNWVPPLYSEQARLLNPSQGPFYSHGQAQLWLAMRGNKPVGRVSSHFSRRYDTHAGGTKGFFGFFACENNGETASALFANAEEHLRQNGRTEIEGPFSFTVYDELGILVDGFDEMPAFMIGHNPPYYGPLLESCGFKKAIDWLAYRGRRGEIDLGLSHRLINLTEQIVTQRHLTLRHVNVKSFNEDAGLVKQLFDKAWDRNWGHVPMSNEEFWGMARGLKQLVVPELSVIAEVKGKPVGIAICIYDINPIVKQIGGRLLPFGFIKMMYNIKRMKRFRVLLMGVEPRQRGRGFEVAMYVNTIRKAIELGFEEAEMSVIVESNQPMIKSIENLEARLCKRLRIYSRPIA